MQAPPFGRKAPSFDRSAPPMRQSAVAAPRQYNWEDGFVAFFFSPRGRMSRLGYRVSRTIFIPLYLGLSWVSHQIQPDLKATTLVASHDPAGLYYGAFEVMVVALGLLVVFVSDTIVTIKRWHDLDKSGWWALLGAIPILGWTAQLIACARVRGTQGPNRFGPAPGNVRY